MKNLKILTLIISLVLCCSCEQPYQVNQTNNPDYDVSFLFEYDGIKVYKFKDHGRSVYFTNVPGIVKYETGGKISKTINQ